MRSLGFTYIYVVGNGWGSEYGFADTIIHLQVRPPYVFHLATERFEIEEQLQWLGVEGVVAFTYQLLYIHFQTPYLTEDRGYRSLELAPMLAA